MTWQWLSSVGPWGPVVAAGITAGFGGWLGGLQSRKNQERQYRFDRDKALTEHGRDKVDNAISALQFLHEHNMDAGVVFGHWGLPPWNVDLSLQELPSGDTPERLPAVEADLSCQIVAQHVQLGRSIPYLTDAAARRDIEFHPRRDLGFVASGGFRRW